MVHAGGTLVEKVLAAGETIKLDTGCLVALQPSVNYDIGFTGGIKNSLFGGEGLFLATLTGPGKVWLQSLPFSRLAGRVLANAGSRGSADEVQISNSSGHPRLDDSARDTVRRWRFIPAKRGSEPVSAWVLVPVSFKLEG